MRFLGCQRETMGGPYISIYKKPCGHEVPGLVYAEASHPDQKERFEAALGKSLEDPGTAVFGRATMRLYCALAMSLVRHKPPVLLRLSRRQTAAQATVTDNTVRRDSAGATS